MDHTKIQWTDATWNPVRGCSRVSPGCDNCYAMRQAHRSSGPGGAYEGLTRIGKRGVDWAGFARLVPGALDQPLRWKRHRRIFVNSMSDMFHPSLTNDEIAAVFGVMAGAPQHTFQVLTKRPMRAADWYAWLKREPLSEREGEAETCIGEGYALVHGNSPLLNAKRPDWPLPNVWLGVSVEDRTAKVRIDQLRELPAALRFLSLEPLLEDLGELDLRGIGWVIVGGESGYGARPFDMLAARKIVAQCRNAGVRCFVKQMGADPIDGIAGCDVPLRARKGDDIAEWPAELQVREFPEASVA